MAFSILLKNKKSFKKPFLWPVWILYPWQNYLHQKKDKITLLLFEASKKLKKPSYNSSYFAIEYELILLHSSLTLHYSIWNLKSDVNWALASRTNLIVKALFQLNSGIKQRGQDMFQSNRRQILV